MELQYFYFVNIILIACVWIFLFYKRPDLRREMIIMSLGLSWLSFSQFLFVNVYWTPQYLVPVGSWFGLEEWLLVFFYGGLASVLWKYLFKTRYVCDKKISILYARLVVLASALVFLCGHYLLVINPIYSSALAMMVMGCAFLWKYPFLYIQIIVNSLVTAILFHACLVFTSQFFPTAIETFWNLSALSGYLWWGVPVEEFMWHFALGFAFPLLYEAQYNCRII